jgi:hypothetical protein
MKIRTIPVYLSKREYQRFLEDYPTAKNVLARPVVEDDGTNSDLVITEGDKVSIYIDEIPDDRKELLGKAASRRVLETYRRKPRWWMFLLLLCLFSGGLWVVKEQVIPFLVAPQKPTPSPIPSPTTRAKPTIIPTAAPTSKPPEVKITTMILKDSNGAIIPLVNETYSIRPQETVTVTVEVEGVSSARSVKVTYYAVLGKIGTDGVYTAPNKPGSIDLLTIKVVERNTGSVLAQRTLKMKIIVTR